VYRRHDNLITVRIGENHCTNLSRSSKSGCAPRFHQQYLPDTVFYETSGLPPETLSALAAMGYSFREQRRGARSN